MAKLRAKYDVIVIGSGPSAVSTALQCAEHGLQVLCVDNLLAPETNKLSNGIFAHSPTLEINTLLSSANLFCELKYHGSSHGITFSNLSLNLPQLIDRKNKIFLQFDKDLFKFFNDANVDFYNANAKLLSSNSIEFLFSYSEPAKIIHSDHIVLATESIPFAIGCAPVDHQHIFDSSCAFSIQEIPQRIAILGAGVIGLEIAGIWNRLGSKVILLDAQESFLSLVDNQLSREAYTIFSEQGLELKLGTRVVSTKIVNKKVIIEYEDIDGLNTLRVDKLIVASGRKPNSQLIASPSANLLIDQNNFVYVNENCRTNLPNVYAIGDLTMLGPMLPQKGIAEGVFVADRIAGIRSASINYETIPNVIYTEPQIAWVGQTEQTLKSKGDLIEIRTSNLNCHFSNKSPNYSNGIVKIISCPKSDVIKGIHIIAKNASDLIAEAVLAMEFSSTTEDLARTSHSHPSLSEAIRHASKSPKKLPLNSD